MNELQLILMMFVFSLHQNKCLYVCVHVYNFLSVQVLLESASRVILDGIGKHFRHTFRGKVHSECINERYGVE